MAPAGILFVGKFITDFVSTASAPMQDYLPKLIKEAFYYFMIACMFAFVAWNAWGLLQDIAL
jgi:hypothetical protein